MQHDDIEVLKRLDDIFKAVQEAEIDHLKIDAKGLHSTVMTEKLDLPASGLSTAQRPVRPLPVLDGSHEALAPRAEGQQVEVQGTPLDRFLAWCSSVLALRR